MSDQQKPASPIPRRPQIRQQQFQQPPYNQSQPEEQKPYYSLTLHKSQPSQFQQLDPPPQEAGRSPTGWSSNAPTQSSMPVNSHQLHRSHRSLKELLLYIGIGILIIGVLGSAIMVYAVLNQGKNVSHQTSQVPKQQAAKQAFPSIGTPIQIFNRPAGAAASFYPGFYLGWSHDGSQLYGMRLNGTVQVWNTTTWGNILTYEIPYSLLTVSSFSPNREYFATWSLADQTPGTIRVWDTLTGKKVLAYQGHSKDVSAIAWSPDGTRIASDDGDSVQIWSATTGNTSLTLHADSGILALAWSPDGTQIAVASETSIQIWNVTTGKTILTFPGSSDGAGELAWSPDGRYIALAGLNVPIVQIWDATKGNLLLTYKGHTSPVTAITWSPDSKRIATGSFDKTVQIWDPATGNNIFTYHGHSGTVGNLAWSPDGRFIASSGGDGTVQIWWAI